ncbi:integrase [Rhodomicrobium udaipurense JA643]|uniref:Integrase n=1 Tax=Rhodomicrobium udaipurense TaxID=1202716 RepID=A0A8I1GII3_9HYPH|nr:integrase [Rhodomicrobium udaipurense JA643]MBJ7544385.1 integrase [Rhodomicrobium udaipurense]
MQAPMERFFGGSPATVILKLAIASLIIGITLSFFGLDPANIYDAMLRLGDWISSLGLDTLKQVVRYIALGAVIVVPIWILVRVLSLLGSDRRSK